MAFDMAFDARGTAGYVTDPSYGVPILGYTEAYPHTYTNVDGYSVNGGSGGSQSNPLDRASGNDPRIAGINYQSNTGTLSTFTVDLASGSAPGAGAYTIDLAFGDAGSAQKHYFEILDTSTQLIDGTGGGSGISTAAGHFIDATGVDVGATTTWTGTPASKTFATTMAVVAMCHANIGGNSTLAHFRLTLAGGGPTIVEASFAAAGAATAAAAASAIALTTASGAASSTAAAVAAALGASVAAGAASSTAGATAATVQLVSASALGSSTAAAASLIIWATTAVALGSSTATATAQSFSLTSFTALASSTADFRGDNVAEPIPERGMLTFASSHHHR